MKNKFLKFFNTLSIGIILVIVLTNCSKEVNHADLVLYNGTIITVDSNNTMAEAIAVSGDTIMFIGSNNSVKKFIDDSTKVIDLKGQTAFPGFIDSHAHLIGTGKAQIILNLQEAKNWDEVVYLVAQAVSKAKFGEWIIGRGWHQEKWNPKPSKMLEDFHIIIS